MYKKLLRTCADLETRFGKINNERKAQLQEVGEYIYAKARSGKPIRLTVICTHNSRRSHMGQLWLQAASAYYGIDKVQTYSGGTESTAFNPRAVMALKDAGFKISKLSTSENPSYSASYSNKYPSMQMYSKKFDEGINMENVFAAIMVCSEADEACPFVPGADARFSIPFKDPKFADDTPSEKSAYAETCQLIGTEMLYVMHYAKNKITITTQTTSQQN